MLEHLLVGVIYLFPVSEVALAIVKRSRGGAAESQDRGSMALLWLAIAIGVALAFAARGIPATRIAGPASLLRLVALALLVGGLAVRWTAILTLGKLFTVDVAIHADHAVVQEGLYRYMRHPSYTGLLVAFLGFGVALGNWLSVAGLLVPIALGVANRVVHEERTLHRALGPAYADYCARTKRFIPGLL